MFFRIVAGLALLLAVGIGVVLAIAATKPDTFQVIRSTTIDAPPEKVFPLIENFHEWGKWSPWEKLDPNLKRTYSGPESGVGAVYEWAGNGEAGEGRMEIVEAPAPSRVRIDLQFIKPFAARNTALFELEPEGDGTKVTWTMAGPNLFIGKVMSVFISMDQMVGQSFEEGLASMKAAAEG